MPVYEYQCKACGRDFEYQQRMSDPDKTDCEVCGGALDRLISRTAFALKGGGWYKDLYASAKPERGDKGDKVDGTAEAKADGKAADKPGAKAEAPAASADKPASKPSSDSGGSSAGSGSAGSSSAGSGSAGSGGGGSSGSVAKAS
jgi:putative FmdB family regulatory protein